MKKLTYIFGIVIALTTPTITVANESIDSEEFNYLVCSYIEDSENLESALNKIDNVADDLLLTNTQQQILEDLEEGTLTSEVYCEGLEF